MEMKVNSTLIKSEREKRAWSQEHLALVAGVGLRTIQRIETTGIASYESVKAIASAYGMAAPDFNVEQHPALPAIGSPSQATLNVRASELQHHPVIDKSSSEWKRLPTWVRIIFLGSSLIRMDRRQLKQLEKIEFITASVLAVLGVLAIFFSEAAAVPLIFLSMAMCAAAYFASLNIRIGDQFSVWPWLATPAPGPVRFAFSALLLLVLTIPLWA